MQRWWTRVLGSGHSEYLTTSDVGIDEIQVLPVPPDELLEICTGLQGLKAALVPLQRGLPLAVPQLKHMSSTDAEEELQKRVVKSASILLSTVSTAGSRLMRLAGTFEVRIVYKHIPCSNHILVHKITCEIFKPTKKHFVHMHLCPVLHHHALTQFCLVDEAAQLVEAEGAILLERWPEMGCLVLVGDHRQLPATVMSRVAVEAGYGRSTFARLADAGLK
jgi:hypothetical protein